MSFFAEKLVTEPDIWELVPMGEREQSAAPPTARTIKKWHTDSAYWPANAASRAPERKSCSSRPVTIEEPIISPLERVRCFHARAGSASNLSASRWGGIRPAHRPPPPLLLALSCSKDSCNERCRSGELAG
jgi:hypothetical protein